MVGNFRCFSMHSHKLTSPMAFDWRLAKLTRRQRTAIYICHFPQLLFLFSHHNYQHTTNNIPKTVTAPPVLQHPHYKITIQAPNMADKQANQTFSFEIVSCLLAALSESGATVGAKHYAMMAKIDGTKSQSGYEHMFRAVKARAKEINQQNANGGGENGTPVKKTKSAASTPASKRKRGKHYLPK